MRFRAELTQTHLTASTALLLAAATTLGYMESVLLPTLPVPGLRLGLANVAVVLALYKLGSARALFVSLGRVLLVGLATGSLLGPAGVMSIAGAFAAWAAMVALSSDMQRFSVVGWSLGGSAAHSVAQLVAATFLAGSAAPLLLLPVSLGTSLVTGVSVGLVARLLISRMPRASASFAGV